MQDQNSTRAEWQDHPEVVVSKAVSAAMEKSEPSESIDALLSCIGRNLDADRAYIFEFAGADTLYNSYEWCAEGVSRQIDNLDSTPLGIYDKVWMPCFRAHKPVVINDVESYAEKDPVVADILRPQGITSLLAIPLFVEGDFVGFIGIDNPRHGVVEGMAAFLKTIAGFTAALLRHRDNVQRLYDLSSHDRVSGTFNTLYLLDQVENARRSGDVTPKNGLDISDVGDVRHLSVVYCNIVQFKEINAAFGIDAGNRCLADVGRVLREAFGTRCVSRYSADHFIVLYGKDDVWDRIEDAHKRVLALRDDFKLWMVAGVCKVEPSQKLSAAVDLAKVACDQIPKDGQSYKCLYTGKIEEELERRKYLQDHIEQAIDEGWVQVYFQPVIRTLTGRLAGVEALSRWKDPVYGSVSPAVFVPALEEKHLSWKLLAFVIERVCAGLDERYHNGQPVVPVSVNVSRTDFESCEPFDVINGAVTRHNIPTSLICVEITESVAMNDPEGIEEVVERFSDAGYEVWMDDFGSAYSSLNTLKDFTFGKLKLDMLFMHNFNQRSKIIISSIISMAKKLGVHTLAEGVETREQVDFLIDAGCEEIQGFYFSQPLPMHKVIEYADAVPPETHDQRELYNDLGLVKLHAHDTAGFVFYKDGKAHVLYGNERFRHSVRSHGLDSPEQIDMMVNDKTGRFAQAFHMLADRAMESRTTEVMPFAFNGRRFQMAVRVAAESPAGTVLMANVRDMTAPPMSFDLEGESRPPAPWEGLASWSPLLLRENADEAAVHDAGAPAKPSGDAVSVSVPADGQTYAEGTGAKPTDLVELQVGSRAADELRRGFSVPSTDVTLSTLEIRHSQEDALETFSALRSIFIVLVNIDLESWKIQPIKIAKVTKDYLSKENQDYRKTAEEFLKYSVADSYREVLRRFVDPSAIEERLSRYGTVTLDYMGAHLGWCRIFLIPITTNDEGRVTKALFAVRDVNAEKEEEARMNYGITHDPLTKAFNRNGLRQVVRMVRGYNGPMAYAIFDIDNFKQFNDTFGHKRGDDLLVRVAQLLIDSFGATEYVARIGGDEFVVLFTHYYQDQDGTAIRERVAQVNEKLAHDSAELVADVAGAKPVAVSMSVGVVVSLDGYRDDLYNLADKALYEEKAAGKGGSCVNVVENEIAGEGAML